MRLNSALDENERLDNELVGQLVRQARVESAATSPLKSQNTIEVRENEYLFIRTLVGIICALDNVMKRAKRLKGFLQLSETVAKREVLKRLSKLGYFFQSSSSLFITNPLLCLVL